MATYKSQPLKDQYRAWIQQYSAQFGVDPKLAEAMILQESTNDPNAVSNKGASGLTQLMPGTAAEMGVTDLSNPEQQIAGGIKYLGLQLQKYGTPELALAAYNAGPGAVNRYNGIPPFKETQNYVSKIMSTYTAAKAADPNAFGGDSTAAATTGNDAQSKALQDLGNSTAAGYNKAADATSQGIKQIDALMGSLPDPTAAVTAAGKSAVDAITTLSQESKNKVTATYDQIAAGDAVRREILTKLLGRDNYNPIADNSVAATTSANLSAIESRLNATVAAEQKMQDATIMTNPAAYIQRMILGNQYTEGRQALVQQSQSLKTAADNTRTTIDANAKLATDAQVADPTIAQNRLNAELDVAELQAKATETQGKFGVDIAYAQADQVKSLAQLMGYKVDLVGKQATQTAQANEAAANAVTAPLEMRAKTANVKTAEANATIAGLDAAQSVKFNAAKTELMDLTTKVQTEQQRAALIDAQVKLDAVEKLAGQGTLNDLAYYEAMAAASKARQSFGAEFISETGGTAANTARVGAMDAAAAVAAAPIRNAATQEEWMIKANEYAKVIGAEQAMKDGAAKLGITQPTNSEKLTVDQKTALAAASAGGQLGGNPIVAARVASELGVLNSAKYPGLQATVSALSQLKFKSEDKLVSAFSLKAEEQAMLSPKEINAKINEQFGTVTVNSNVFNGNINPYGLVPPIPELITNIKSQPLKDALTSKPPTAEDMVSLATFAKYLKTNSGGSPVKAGNMLAEYVRASMDYNNTNKGFDVLGIQPQSGLNLDAGWGLGELDLSVPADAIRYYAKVAIPNTLFR